jgi:hypothetical protein
VILHFYKYRRVVVAAACPRRASNAGAAFCQNVLRGRVNAIKPDDIEHGMADIRRRPHFDKGAQPDEKWVGETRRLRAAYVRA